MVHGKVVLFGKVLGRMVLGLMVSIGMVFGKRAYGRRVLGMKVLGNLVLGKVEKIEKTIGIQQMLPQINGLQNNIKGVF
jgi:hypothetical protein